MLAVTLKFDLLKRGAPDVTVGAVTWLLAALVHNGNLLNSYLLAADSKGVDRSRGRSDEGLF